MTDGVEVAGQNSVRCPSLAAATAASQPACPDDDDIVGLRILNVCACAPHTTTGHPASKAIARRMAADKSRSAANRPASPESRQSRPETQSRKLS